MKRAFGLLCGALSIVIFPMLTQAAGSATLQIAVGGTAGSPYAVGQLWILHLTSSFPGKNFSLCAIDNHGVQSCTPWAVTDGSGSWTGTGNFDASTVGNWTEWVSFASQNETSNNIVFTVSAATSGSTSAPVTTPTQTTTQSGGSVSSINSTVNSTLNSYLQSLNAELQNLHNQALPSAPAPATYSAPSTTSCSALIQEVVAEVSSIVTQVNAVIQNNEASPSTIAQLSAALQTMEQAVNSLVSQEGSCGTTSMGSGTPNSAPSTSGSTSPQLVLNGTETGSYAVGQSWTLALTSNVPTTSFTICALDNGTQSCTPNWGTTDANGNWSQSGSFPSSTIGSWTEWITFPNGAASNQISFTVGGFTSAPETSGSSITFPVTILVTASSLNVRSAPNTNASLAGSQTLYDGNEFTAVNEVTGESVNGNDLWWVSSSGNYVWSGGTTVAGSGAAQIAHAIPAVVTETSAPTLTSVQGYNPSTSVYETTQNILKTGDTYLLLYGTFASSGNSVNVNGQALPVSDLTYQSSTQINVFLGSSYANTSFTVSVTDTNGTTAPITVNGSSSVTPPSLNNPITKTVTSGGVSYSVTYSYLTDGEVRATFTYKNKPYAVQNYNIFGTAGAIALVQSNGSFGFPWTGQADLTLLQLANQISINAPANQTIFPGFTFATPLYYVDDASPYYVSTPTNAYGIKQSTYSNVPTPNLYYLTVDANGNITAVQAVNISLQGVITTGAVITIQQQNSTQQNVLGGSSPSGYLNSLVSSLQSAGYQISENTDALGQIIGMASKNGQPALYFNLGDQVATNAPSNSNGSCYLQAPDGGAPIPIEVSPDGTIPHISNNFNVVVDPGAYSAINWGGISNEEIQSDLIQAFLKGYYPYTQVGGLPQPTETPDANAIVIVAFANIPSVEYSYFDNNGQQVNQTINEAANTITLLPGSAGFNYVPTGSANLVINALNAGKQVVVVTYNSQYFANLANDQANEFYGDTEHEMGHTLGLDDDYENGASPMRGGDLAADGTIAIQPAIYNYLFDIQQKKAFTTVKCGTPQMLTSPSAGPNTGYVPIATNGSTNPNQILWVIQGSCTQDQLDNGYINYPLADGGCYLPTPTSSVVISFGSFPDQESETATCIDNYGNNYACVSTDCGGAGQLACPVNTPQGTCLDSDGNPITCPGTNGFDPIPPPPPPEEGGYECASDGSCVYNAAGGPYSDSTCDDACVDTSGN